MSSDEYDCHDLLEQAIERKDNSEVARLVPLLNADEVSFSLWSAVCHKYTYAVQLLVERYTCGDNGHSFWLAVARNDVQGVKMLLPICDPLAQNSICLQRAVLNNNMEIFELLYPVSDACLALQELQNSEQFEENPARAQSYVFIELEARVLRKKLKHFATNDGRQQLSKKI